ncbi:MAG TPA: TraR/DksA C4-type zinc finger protein [Syntrophomonadaceae bacterium]|nr:TraR/DksA C4-type zinc finger protein [Syntrophomonadaceae bacterium]
MDYKEKLLSKKGEIEGIIEERRTRLMTSMKETTAELSLYDQHPADIGSEVYEREKDIGLLEALEFEKEKIDDALKRYEQGLYGVCEGCGQNIDPNRLDRVVNTTLCIECARKLSGKSTRPAEEDVLSMSSGFDKGENFPIAGYDFYEHK